jgi:hypothetical protein
VYEVTGKINVSKREQNSDSWRPAGKEWPLLFSYRVPVEVQGLLARIELSGRATAYVDDDGSVWMDGVNPGSFAVSGDSLKDAEVDLRSTLTDIFLDIAEVDLRSTLTDIFLDIAESSGDIAEFKRQAEDFLYSTDNDTVAEWEAALSRVRKSAGMAVAGLKRRSADQNQPSVRVTTETPQADTPLLLSAKPESLEVSAAA